MTVAGRSGRHLAAVVCPEIPEIPLMDAPRRLRGQVVMEVLQSIPRGRTMKKIAEHLGAHYTAANNTMWRQETGNV